MDDLFRPHNLLRRRTTSSVLAKPQRHEVREIPIPYCESLLGSQSAFPVGGDLWFAIESKGRIAPQSVVVF